MEKGSNRAPWPLEFAMKGRVVSAKDVHEYDYEDEDEEEDECRLLPLSPIEQEGRFEYLCLPGVTTRPIRYMKNLTTHTLALLPERANTWQLASVARLGMSMHHVGGNNSITRIREAETLM